MSLIQEILSGYWDNEGGVSLGTDNGGLKQIKVELTELTLQREKALARISELEAQVASAKAEAERYKQLIQDAYKSEGNGGGIYNVIRRDAYRVLLEKMAVWEALTETSNPKESDTLDLEKSVEILTGVPSKPKPLVTKHNEVMATFQVGKAELVAFPRTWRDYKHAIIAAGHEGKALGFHIRPIEKDGKIQYMVTGILGVAPQTIERSEESE